MVFLAVLLRSYTMGRYFRPLPAIFLSLWGFYFFFGCYKGKFTIWFAEGLSNKNTKQ